MKILVDVDGVLAEQVVTTLAQFNAEHGTAYQKSDIVTYDQPIGNTDISTLLTSLSQMEEWVESLPPIDGAAYALHALAERGHTIIICTSRPGLTAVATERWLDKQRMECHELTFTSDKSSEVGNVLIDDSPAHVRAFAATGRKAILFDQPWNRNTVLTPPAVRCGDWVEVLAELG